MSTLSLSPTTSSYVRSSAPGTTTTGDSIWVTNQTSTNNIEVAYTKFDLSSIPAGSIINSATLTLTTNGSGSSTTDTLKIFKVTSNWSGPQYYNARPSYSGVYATITGMTKTSNLVCDLKSLVIEWVNGSPQYGIAIENSTAGGSKAYYNETPANSALRPKLIIDYTPNSPPYAPTLSGPSSTLGGNYTVNWTYSDPDGNTQGWYQYQISKYSDFSVTSGADGGDTGQVNSSQTNFIETRNQYGTWYHRIRVWDTIGSVSNWSNTLITFVNHAPNAPVMNTNWVDGQVLATRTPNVTWTFSDPDGNAQGSFLIEVINSAYSATIYSSGWRNETSTRSFVLPEGAIPSDGQFYIRMRVMDSNGVINQANGNGPDANFFNKRVIIDTTQPTYVSVGGNTNGRRTDNPQYGNVAVNGTFRVWVNGVGDATSGVNRVQFPSCNATTGLAWSAWYNGTYDGSGNWYCDIPIAVVGNNAEGIYFTDPYIFDNAGNVTGCTRIQTYVDRTAPTIASIQGYSYTNLTSGTRRIWAYGVDGGLSGIASVSCNYTVPGANAVSLLCTASGSDYYVDIPLSAQGEYKADFYCVDRAGNWMANPVSKAAYFFVDSQRANDPNPNVTYGTTTASFMWNAFSDPFPSAGYDKTFMYLGEWNGLGWVGTPLYNGTSIGNVVNLVVSGLKQGTRYRYTVTQYDKSGNESSYTYKEFVTKKKIGEYHIQKAGQLVILPVYDLTSGITGSKALRTKVAAGVGCFELVPITDASASAFHLATSKGVKAIAK